MQSALFTITLLLISASMAHATAAHPPAEKKKDTTPPPDTIIFTNGDQLSGTFVREVGGTVTFHSDIVGDFNVPWS
ncbi:MAG: hypothetical protein WA426_02600, partial [Silvibacterium sp.]